ncbi:MAG TPA: TolC family protein, partial [Candidatus Binataceae bacterium]
MRAKKSILALAVATLTALAAGPGSAAESALTVNQLVEIALESSPMIKGARYRWDAAEHSIKQAYAPNDPIFTYTNSDSPKNPFGRASLREYNATESFQFPGKALLQADQAKRNAEIARFVYEAAVRDVRAATETAYYQLVLDDALGAINAENVQNLDRVLRVTQISYAANRVTQTDFISAEFDLAAAKNLQLQYRTAIANDETTLNQLLYRPPGSPLDVNRTLQLDALRAALAQLVDLATAARQEILEAALTERNSDTALRLAKMEYLPDFTLAYQFDNYLIPNFAPRPSQTEDHVLAIGLNVPLFFWLKQNEDVERARVSLEAARSDLNLVRSQTAATVTTLYRSAQYGYETSLLYRDSLTPLARQDFEVALIGYQSGKLDFNGLSGALKRNYDARINFLQAANQFLAGEVALEQAIG